MSLATWVRRSGSTHPTGGVTASHRSLAELRPGQAGVIVGWRETLDRAAVRRFEDLGFAEGADVSVLRRAPLGDPCVYAVAGSEIAVRGEHARHLLVDPR